LRRLREEQNQQWAEQAKKWAEHQQRWEHNQQELQRLREEQNQQWAEQAKKWAEHQQRWEHNQQELQRLREAGDQKWDEWRQEWKEERARLDQMIQSIQKLTSRHETTLGALGARWGLRSEQSFRNALKGILETSFGVEVVNVVEYDDTGEVFGRPEQVDLDIIIKNGLLIICEIKSSMSKGDMYIFDRKVAFYQRKHQRQATRRIVVSPMVDPPAQAVATKLGIEVYSFADALDSPIVSLTEPES
jgi:hypothetical protein